MDKEPQDSQRPKPERKSPPLGNNLVWYLLALGVGTLLVASLLGPKGQASINFSDLQRLIEQGAPAKNPDAAIEVQEGTEGKEVTVRYSDLEDLKFGPAEITGTVTRQVVAPEEKQDEAHPKTRFHTPRLGLEDDQNALYRLAVEKGLGTWLPL